MNWSLDSVYMLLQTAIGTATVWRCGYDGNVCLVGALERHGCLVGRERQKVAMARQETRQEDGFQAVYKGDIIYL